MIYCKKGWCCSLWRVYCFDKLSLTNQLQDLPFQSRLKNISFMLFTLQVFYINCRWRILFYHLVKIFLSFFLSFFSDIEVWPKKVRFFSLAPTSARPVLVECFSGRFSCLCVNLNMND